MNNRNNYLILIKKVFLIKNILLIQLSILFFCGACFAQEKQNLPLWEFGLFSGAARIPHYRGSDEYNIYALPLPYFIYRGEFIRAGRDGVKGIFYKNNYIETNISLSGNPPVDGDNDARKGMPDLDALFEFGPAIKWFFMGKDQYDNLYLESSLRAASSLGFDGGLDLKYQGLRGGINLIYNNKELFKQIKLRFGVNAGVDFTDSRLNAYFYDVEQEYTNSERNYYESDSGYAGFSLSGFLQKTLTKSLSLGGYVRLDNINGAVFEDSSLVRDKNNFVVGCALTWKIFESKRRVMSEEDENY
ncbi:MipA/OmpV family protein [Desulfobacterales bacterium HSG17]|nr:MipA/OmpV family protein [Desulfobacterales bacterium HSG17]